MKKSGNKDDIIELEESWKDFFKLKNDDEYSKGKKIQLSISPLAMSVINSDGELFFGPDSVISSTKANKKPITYMVNTIIDNFIYESKVNPDEYMSQKQKMYNDILIEGFGGKKRNSEFREKIYKIVEMGIMSKEKEIFAAENILPVYAGKKVYINAESIDKVKFIGKETIGIYKKPSKFISALVEDYTRHTFSEREKIIRKDRFEIISNAISKRVMLKLEMGGNVYMVKPIEIIPDGNRGNYLLCLSTPVNSDEYTVHAPRISNISKVTKIDSKWTISKEEKASADKFIEEKGIANVSSALQDYCVKMTEMGKAIYRRIVTKDVSLVKIEGDIYHFKSSEYAMSYFMRSFGKEAVILNEDMRKKYMEFYREALEAYEKE